MSTPVDDVHSPSHAIASALVGGPTTNGATSSVGVSNGSGGGLSTCERVIGEIISTEKLYVNSLQGLQSSYLQPLQNMSLQAELGIKPQQIQHIFSNLQAIVGFHVILLEELTRLSTVQPNQQIDELAKIFTKYADFMKMYTSYINNYEKSLTCLTALGENKKWVKFLQETRAKSKDHMDLMSLLIMPVQRLPRYELLLKELSRQSHKSADGANSGGHPQLDAALTKIVEINAHVNETKRLVDRVAELLLIQVKLGNSLPLDQEKVFKSGSLYAPWRRVIRTGELKKRGTGLLTSDKSRTHYLFNDILLYCNSHGKYKHHVPLLHASLSTPPENDFIDVNLGFELQCNVPVSDPSTGAVRLQPTAEKLTLFCQSQSDKDAWVKDIEIAIHESESISADGFQSVVPNRLRRMSDHHTKTATSAKSGVTSGEAIESVEESTTNEPLSPVSTNGKKSTSSNGTSGSENAPTANGSANHKKTMSSGSTVGGHSRNVSVSGGVSHSRGASTASGGAHSRKSSSATLSVTSAGAGAHSRQVSTTSATHSKSPSVGGGHSKSPSMSAHSKNSSGGVSHHSKSPSVSLTHHAKNPSTASASSASASVSGSATVTPVPASSPALPEDEVAGHQTESSTIGASASASVTESHSESESNQSKADSIAPSESSHVTPSKPSSSSKSSSAAPSVASTPQHSPSPSISSQSSHTPFTIKSPTALVIEDDDEAAHHAADAEWRSASDKMYKMSRNDITSLKMLKTPTPNVKSAMESVGALLNAQSAANGSATPRGTSSGSMSPRASPVKKIMNTMDDWQALHALLVKPNFLTLMKEFNERCGPLNEKADKKISALMNDPTMTVEAVTKASSAAGVLWAWVLAYYKLKKSGSSIITVMAAPPSTKSSVSTSRPSSAVKPKTSSSSITRPSTASASSVAKGPIGKSASTSASATTTAPQTPRQTSRTNGSSASTPHTPKSSASKSSGASTGTPSSTGPKVVGKIKINVSRPSSAAPTGQAPPPPTEAGTIPPVEEMVKCKTQYRDTYVNYFHPPTKVFYQCSVIDTSWMRVPEPSSKLSKLKVAEAAAAARVASSSGASTSRPSSAQTPKSSASSTSTSASGSLTARPSTSSSSSLSSSSSASSLHTSGSSTARSSASSNSTKLNPSPTKPRVSLLPSKSTTTIIIPARQNKRSSLPAKSAKDESVSSVAASASSSRDHSPAPSSQTN